MDTFRIRGGKPLRGTITVSGAKNAALPCLAATILTRGVSTLRNVPDIADVRTFLSLLEYLGAQTTFRGQTVTVDTRQLHNRQLPLTMVGRLRASILLLGPLLARFGKVHMAYPGGCIIGKRSVRAHTDALENLGAQLIPDQEALILKSKGRLTGKKFLMWETSVTATENALLAAALAKGITEIHLAASEPHVQDLCHMLVAMGSKIEGIGTNTLRVHGRATLRPATHRVIGDAIEMGTFAIAATIVPGSQVTISGVDPDELSAFWNKLIEAGGDVSFDGKKITVRAAKKLTALEKLETRVYPGFSTDLQAPFSLVLAKAKGVTKIFETLYEGRFVYLQELEKMGVRSEVYNPHQALVVGPTAFKPAAVQSHDLRAGATLVLAGLVAKGVTTVYNINYIDRGYDDLAGKLRTLGADIERISVD